MPALSTTPPDEGTYRYVLQHRRFIAQPGVTHPIRLASYDESRESIGVSLNGGPMRHTVFVCSENTVNRAVRDGWVDVTETWRKHLEGKRPQLSTPSQLAVRNVLTDSWKSKAEIVSLSGIADSEWRTTIRLLEDRGVAETNHGPRSRGKASNRSYLYKRGERWEDAIDATS